MIIGRNFVNEYYEDEKLYSTGNDELDEMLEKAFCEGYEYAQKEFAEKEEKEKKPIGKGALIGAGTGAVGLAGAGAIIGESRLRKFKKNVSKQLTDKQKQQFEAGFKDPTARKFMNKARGTAAAINGLTGAVIGAGVGAGIGAIKKHRIKKAKQESNN